MLSYAFKRLNFNEYRKVSTEDFENIYELFAEILIIALNKQIKQGLHRDYIEIDETTSSIRGKINISESINDLSFINKKLNCSYDEFSINSYLNRIIKTTLNILLSSPIRKNQRHSIKRILFYFRDVDEIPNLNSINWKIRYDRNNQDYRLIIGICNLCIKGLLQSDEKGDMKLMSFLDDSLMSRLYEKFILNYYIKEHKEIKAYSPQIQWQLDDDFSEFLPTMQTDITLESDNKILIIDAKYYSDTFQYHFDSKSIHSKHLYQIFTYVKNREIEMKYKISEGYKDSKTSEDSNDSKVSEDYKASKTSEDSNDSKVSEDYKASKTYKDYKVSGMLLYAQNLDDDDLENIYKMSGNDIIVKTLNLNKDFKDIRAQLDSIIEDYLLV